MKRSHVMSSLVLSVFAVALLSTASPATANTGIISTSVSSVIDVKSTPKISTTYPYKNLSSASIYLADKGITQTFSIPYSSGAVSGMRPEIQSYNTATKSWSVLTYGRQLADGNKTALGFSYNFSGVVKEGITQIRVYIPATSKTNAFTSATSSITFKKQGYGQLALESTGAKNLPYNGYLQYKVNTPSSVKILYSQRYDGAKKQWVNVAQIPLNSTTTTTRQYWWKIYHDGVAKTVGYRLYSPPTATHSEYATKQLNITFAKGLSQINNTTPIDNTMLSKFTKDKAGFYVTNAPGAKVWIQLYNTSTKKWSGATSVTAANTPARQNILVPYPKLGVGTYQLRVAVMGTANFNAATSKSTTVKYVDQNQYTGTAKAAYNIIKPYCPGVTIQSSSFSGNIIGRAEFPKHQILVHPNLKGDNLRYTALHECGHILQLSAFNEDIGALNARGSYVYGNNKRGSGMEIQADCIAQHLGGVNMVRYSYYTSNKKCSAGQLASAKKVVQGLRF